MQKINTPVLVLDKAYMPLNIVPARRAIKYIINGKAAVVENGSTVIQEWQIPSVIKLSNFIGHAAYGKIKVRFNKRTLLERDNYSCQYCGKPLNKEKATIDHVVPRRGGYKGRTVWSNCVIACQPCNTTKGNRTPQQASMALLREPKYPHYLNHLSRVLKRHSAANKGWEQYFII